MSGWGRNGEGGTEDGYAMGELAKAWTEANEWLTGVRNQIDE